jgi:hypothetical protein
MPPRDRAGPLENTKRLLIKIARNLHVSLPAAHSLVALHSRRRRLAGNARKETRLLRRNLAANDKIGIEPPFSAGTNSGRIADGTPGAAGKRYGVTADASRIETEICDFRQHRGSAHAQPRRGIPVSQLDDVHSALRPNAETLKGLISLDSPSVAKSTGFGTARETMNYPPGL